MNKRRYYLMRIYKDMSFKEISENTGVSINTALGRMRYALINLRKIIEENNISFNDLIFHRSSSFQNTLYISPVILL